MAEESLKVEQTVTFLCHEAKSEKEKEEKKKIITIYDTQNKIQKGNTLEVSGHHTSLTFVNINTSDINTYTHSYITSLIYPSKKMCFKIF